MERATKGSKKTVIKPSPSNYEAPQIEPTLENVLDWIKSFKSTDGRKLSSVTRDLVMNAWVDVCTVPSPSSNVQDSLGAAPRSFFKTRLPTSASPRGAGSIDLRIPDSKNPLSTPEFVKMLPVNDIVDKIDSNSQRRTANPIAIVGASGSTKTTTLFQVATHRYCMYLEVNWMQRGHGYGHIAPFLRNEVAPPDMQQTQADIYADFAGRGISLLILHALGVVTTPEQWLKAQIGGYSDFVRNVILNVSAKANLKPDFVDILYLDLEMLFTQRMGFIVDEAQLLFPFRKGNWGLHHSMQWSFFHFYVHTVMTACPVTLILSGTTFSIIHTHSLVDSFAQTDANSIIWVVTNLPYLEGDQVATTIESCLEMSEVDATLLTSMQQALQGRPGFAGGFVNYLAEHRGLQWDPKEFTSETDELRYAIQQYTKFVITLLKGTFDNIAKLNEMHPAFICMELVLLLKTDLHSSSYINTKNLTTLRYGVAPLRGQNVITLTASQVQQSARNPLTDVTGSSLQPQKLEPMLIAAIQDYVTEQKQTMSSLCVLSNKANSAEAFGCEMAFAILVKLQEMGNIDVCDLLFTLTGSTHFPPWLKGAELHIKHVLTDRQHVSTFIDNAKSEISVMDNIIYNATWNEVACLLDENSGADGMFVLKNTEDTVYVTIGSACYPKSIPKKAWAMQMAKTNLNYQYMKEKETEDHDETEEQPSNLKRKLQNGGVGSKKPKVDVSTLDVLEQTSLLLEDHNKKMYRKERKKVLSRVENSPQINILVELPNREEGKAPLLELLGDNILIVRITEENLSKLLGLADANTALAMLKTILK